MNRTSVLWCFAWGLVAMAAHAGSNSKQRVAEFAKLPDWSGVWERFNIGPSGTAPADPKELPALLAAFAETHPPYNAEWEAKYQAIAAREPTTACVTARGFLTFMLAPPLQMQAIVEPEATTFIFSYPTYRYVPTNRRQHTPEDERWTTPEGDAIGHWEGDTLIIDTVNADVQLSGGEGSPAPLSDHAHYVERIRRLDRDTLQYEVTVTDPVALREPWVIKFNYHRVPNLRRVPYEDCAGNERNPIVNGKLTIAPP